MAGERHVHTKAIHHQPSVVHQGRLFEQGSPEQDGSRGYPHDRSQRVRIAHHFDARQEKSKLYGNEYFAGHQQPAKKTVLAIRDRQPCSGGCINKQQQET